MRLYANRRVLRKRADELGIVISSGAVRLLNSVHHFLCMELMRGELGERYDEILTDLVPDAKTWFLNQSTKKTNEYVFESSSHIISVSILNGLEMMLEWLLTVSKCWLDSKNANYLCTRDLECILEKSPLYSFYNNSSTIKSANIGVICDGNKARCYSKPIAVLFNDDVETSSRYEDENGIGGIKETLEKLMERINVKEKSN